MALLPLLLLALDALAAPAAAPPATPLLVPDLPQTSRPERAFDLLELSLDVTLQPEARAVQGSATFRVQRLWGGPAVLDQVDLDIQAVTGGGQALPWHLHGDTLVIELPADFAESAPDAFTVQWRATPDTGMHFREAGRRSPDQWAEVWTQGEGEDHRFWLPSWDHPGDRFVYAGTVRGPEGWRVLTNSGHDMVNYLIMIAAGPYDVVAHTDAPDIEVWVPPGTSAEAVRRVLDPLPPMMAHMGQRTGVPYPWGPYRQVFVQRFLYTGMENTAATIEHERMLVDDRVGQTRSWVESVVAHELAHQWYGDLLTCEDWRELWLNEGFATFMAADWMETHEGPAYRAERVEGWRKSVRARQNPMAGRFFHGPGARANDNVYNRGAAVLHMLRVVLGDDRFWRGVALYTQSHQLGLVATIDLQRAMEQVSGRDLDGFFQQWVELGHVPKLKVTRSWGDGQLTVVVRQLLGDAVPTYSLPVTIEVGAADGTVSRHQGVLDDEELTLVVALEAAPLWVAFDPDGGVVAEVDDVADDEAWVAQLASPSPLARRMAVLALGETDVSEPLAAWLADPQRPRAERTVAAQALGSQGAVGPLLAVLTDSDDRVRQAAAKALEQAVDDSPVKPLTRLAQKDANPDVRQAALVALASLDAAAAVALARPLLRSARDKETRELRNAAAKILGEHGDRSDLAALLDGGAPARLRNAAFSAAARIASRQEGDALDRARVRVARAAEPLLDDLDLRTRQHALNILGEVGDHRTVDRLEAYRRQETVPQAVKAAEGAITRIRGRKTPEPSTPGAQEARIKALEDRLDELSGQLEDLEHRH